MHTRSNNRTGILASKPAGEIMLVIGLLDTWLHVAMHVASKSLLYQLIHFCLFFTPPWRIRVYIYSTHTHTTTSTMCTACAICSLRTAEECRCVFLCALWPRSLVSRAFTLLQACVLMRADRWQVMAGSVAGGTERQPCMLRCVCCRLSKKHTPPYMHYFCP